MDKIEQKINESKKIMRRIDRIMATPKYMFATSGGALAIGTMSNNEYIIIGSMVGFILIAGVAMHNNYLYSVDKVVTSPDGADDWSYVERKSLGGQYEEAEKEIEYLKKLDKKKGTIMFSFLFQIWWSIAGSNR